VPETALGALTIRAVGPATNGGRLPLTELARIAGDFQAALDRLALAIRGREVRPGRRRGHDVEEVQLSITGLSQGSIVLELDRVGSAPLFEDGDLLAESLDALASGVRQIREEPEGGFPRYFSAPLVAGLRNLAGGIGPGRLTRIDVHAGNKLLLSVDAGFQQSVRRFAPERSSVEATVVGRLRMGDFSPAALRCRIDAVTGSTLCDFDMELKDDVFDSLDQMVIASGIAQAEPDSAVVRVMHVTQLQVLPEASHQSFEELQAEQRVRPWTASEQLPGEPMDDDEFNAFLAAIAEARSGEA
jgi:hypothetical protein